MPIHLITAQWMAVRPCAWRRATAHRTARRHAALHWTELQRLGWLTVEHIQSEMTLWPGQ